MTVYYNHVPPTFDKGSDKDNPLLKRLRTILFGRAGSPAQPIKEHLHYRRSFSKDVWSGSWTASALLILLWALALWWGERAVFHHQVKACSWNRWEDWVIALSIHVHGHYKSRADSTLATNRSTPSCCSAGRSSTRRSAHISWPSVASLGVDRPLYRSLPTKIL